MDIVDFIILGAFGVSMLLIMFLFFRNQWVHGSRIAMIKSDFDAYSKGPSYDFMMFTFWIWDADWYFYPQKRNDYLS